jgi:glycosyltransferase involved in cell wall biosynthesis
MNPRFSLVVPFFNEAGNVKPLLERAIAVLSGLGGPYEVILVDDGSTDSTEAEIAEAVARWPECRELRMPGRVGQASALLAGLYCARGDFILTMDGDGQNDPGDFPALLEPVEDGRLDLACGWRTGRRGAWWRRGASRVANLVRRAVLRDGVHDAGCQIRVMRREVVRALRPMDLMQAFVPALAAAAGLRVGERPVRDLPRMLGHSKYGVGELWWRPAAAMVRLLLAGRRRPPP